ncbi:MAG TPA: hypothetical protein DCM40_35995 [Maribacter sp.]|nr:hypothetical protein [Maribacter sp.]|tara:strand:+ start:449 stop:1060 length:612 start_codon:yes stop_codon:yes gene_type:complete
MAYGIEQLKSQIVKSNGIQSTNQWVVVLPRIPGTILESRELNLLCKEIIFPGRAQIVQQRIIGVKGIDVSNGFSEQDFQMRFHVMNDWGIVDYFYKWQDQVLNQRTKYVGYLNDYAKSMRVHALTKGMKYDFNAARRTNNINALLDLLGINLNIDQSFGQKTNYAIEIRDAYPGDISPVNLTNEADGLAELVVLMKHLTWRRL